MIEVGFNLRIAKKDIPRVDLLRTFPEVVVAADTIMCGSSSHRVELSRDMLSLSNAVVMKKYNLLLKKMGYYDIEVGERLTAHELVGENPKEKYVAVQLKREKWGGLSVVYIFDKPSATDSLENSHRAFPMMPTDIVLVSDNQMISIQGNCAPGTYLRLRPKFPPGYNFIYPEARGATLEFPIVGRVSPETNLETAAQQDEVRVHQALELLTMLEEAIHTWQLHEIWRHIDETMDDESYANQQKAFEKAWTVRGRDRELFAKQQTYKWFIQLRAMGLDLCPGLSAEDVTDLINYDLIYHGTDVKVPKSAYKTVIPQIRRMTRNPLVGRDLVLARSKAVRRERKREKLEK